MSKYKTPRGTARKLRRESQLRANQAIAQLQAKLAIMPESELRFSRPVFFHSWDDDGCCTHCGFDGAEWDWWKYHTYEGKASNARMPQCTKHHEVTI